VRIGAVGGIAREGRLPPGKCWAGDEEKEGVDETADVILKDRTSLLPDYGFSYPWRLLECSLARVWKGYFSRGRSEMMWLTRSCNQVGRANGGLGQTRGNSRIRVHSFIRLGHSI
jgi:hypothetical protein